jgi:hypothetical protein
VVGQDRCTVCAERSTGSEIVLDAHKGVARWHGSVESCFGAFGDSANLDVR